MELDPGLPHGRLWVADQGCDCKPCTERRRQAAYEADAETRADEPASETSYWARPRWHYAGGRRPWQIACPQGQYTVGDTVYVHAKTGRVTKVVLAAKTYPGQMDTGVTVDLFYPQSDRKPDTA